MACSKGRVNPDSTTEKRLFADSAGFCQNPSCVQPLFATISNDTIHIAEMAHIISSSDTGPRSKPKLQNVERAKYENLILLCPKCHTIIDKVEQHYPEELLKKWKTDHKHKIDSIFGFTKYDSRKEVRNILISLFQENRTIFDIYGPMTEEMFNPESSMPAQWRRKILTAIIPNNRKILSICTINLHLLNLDEVKLLEIFKQHVEDFEAKHIEGNVNNGLQFPAKIIDLFIEV